MTLVAWDEWKWLLACWIVAHHHLTSLCRSRQIKNVLTKWSNYSVWALFNLTLYLIPHIMETSPQAKHQIFIHFQFRPFLSAVINFYRFSSVFNHLIFFLSVFIHFILFYQVSSIFVHVYPFSSTFIHFDPFHWLLSIFHPFMVIGNHGHLGHHGDRSHHGIYGHHKDRYPHIIQVREGPLTH